MIGRHLIGRHTGSLIAGAAMAIGGAVAIALLVLGRPAVEVAVALAVTGLLLAIAFGMLAHELKPPDPAVEEREQKGPARPHRRMILRFGMGAAALTAVAVAVPAARRVEQATDQLRRTRWTPGTRVVDAAGRLVTLDQVQVGDLLTVYPEGHVDAIDSQAVLIREPPGRFSAAAIDEGWVIEGVVIYSKLCTHMACSLGLYQQRSGTLLCPCHQGAFDVLGSGAPVAGPVRRSLPRLPFEIGADGHLVARGDFSGTVGTGFWWRP